LLQSLTAQGSQVASTDKPDFEGRLLTAVFCRGEPDRVPLVEAGIDQSIKERFLGRPIVGMVDEVDFWASAGYDFVPLSAGLRTIIDAAIHQESSGRFESATGDPPSVAAAKRFAVERLSQRKLTTQKDSGGIRTWAPEGLGFITSLDDLDAYPWPDPAELDYSTLHTIGSVLPDGMGTLPFAGAIFSSVMLMMGMETAMIEMAHESRLFQSLIAKVAEFQVEVVRHVLPIPATGGIWINDDLGHKTGLLVSPRLLRKYLFPHYRVIRDLTAARGLPLLLHSDGRITEILGDLVDLGFNAIHPIDPNGMDIEETRRSVGRSVCLIGNLSLGHPLGLGSPSDVEVETEALIQKMAPGGGYCLSSGNSIPDYVPYENWLAMRDTGLRVGRYPIRMA
jgi:uroporphyrinogen decarboxylase